MTGDQGLTWSPPVVSEVLPNRISCGVFDRCFCKVAARACETLRSWAKCLRGLAITTLPGASRSFNPALPFRYFSCPHLSLGAI